MTNDKAAPASGSIMVVGGGIAGLTTALEAAEVGYEVFLVEKNPYLGGRVAQLNQYFPKLCPPTCGLEINFRRIKDNPNIPSEAAFAIRNIQSNSFLINFVCSNLNLGVAEKQELLEMEGLQDRALATLKHLNTELQKLELRNELQSKVRSDMDQQQREYFLHQQMKTIQEELGGISYDQEIEEMEARAKEKQWSEKVAEHFEKELAKLQRMNPQVAEYSIQRNYLDLFLDLPWEAYSEDKFDLKRAQRILDRDHYGLEDVKERIIEYLAVLKLRKDMKSPILCLYGPPGVGKTSIAKSIARALNKEFFRFSVGGMRDEAEVRGHRRTYVGALPGRIIQAIKRAYKQLYLSKQRLEDALESIRQMRSEKPELEILVDFLAQPGRGILR